MMCPKCGSPLVRQPAVFDQYEKHTCLDKKICKFAGIYDKATKKYISRYMFVGAP